MQNPENQEVRTSLSINLVERPSAEQIKNLTRTYREIFNAKGDFEWGENWTEEEAQKLLEESLSNRDSEDILVTYQDEARDNPIVGFSLGHIGAIEGAIQEQYLPKDLTEAERHEAMGEIAKRLKLRSGDSPILYAQELGIMKDYRSGSKRVADLIAPMLQKAVEHSANATTFWTSRRSKFYFLSKLAEGTEIFRFNDTQDNVLFSVDTARTLSLLEMSEDEINNLLRKKL